MASRRTKPKHKTALNWMDDLVSDLKTQLLGHEPVRSIDLERLEEWEEKRKSLALDRELIVKY